MRGDNIVGMSLGARVALAAGPLGPKAASLHHADPQKMKLEALQPKCSLSQTCLSRSGLGQIGYGPDATPKGPQSLHELLRYSCVRRAGGALPREGVQENSQGRCTTGRVPHGRDQDSGAVQMEKRGAVRSQCMPVKLLHVIHSFTPTLGVNLCYGYVQTNP